MVAGKSKIAKSWHVDVCRPTFGDSLFSGILDIMPTRTTWSNHMLTSWGMPCALLFFPPYVVFIILSLQTCAKQHEMQKFNIVYFLLCVLVTYPVQQLCSFCPRSYGITVSFTQRWVSRVWTGVPQTTVSIKGFALPVL